MTQLMTQISPLWPFIAPNLLREMVDLVGIEPTTSSMPWKRAPSCATGPLVQERNSPIIATRLSHFRVPCNDSQTTANKHLLRHSWANIAIRFWVHLHWLG